MLSSKKSLFKNYYKKYNFSHSPKKRRHQSIKGKIPTPSKIDSNKAFRSYSPNNIRKIIKIINKKSKLWPSNKNNKNKKNYFKIIVKNSNFNRIIQKNLFKAKKGMASYNKIILSQNYK